MHNFSDSFTVDLKLIFNLTIEHGDKHPTKTKQIYDSAEFNSNQTKNSKSCDCQLSYRCVVYRTSLSLKPETQKNLI